MTVRGAQGAAAPVTPAPAVNTFPFIINLVIVLDAAATCAARVSKLAFPCVGVDDKVYEKPNLIAGISGGLVQLTCQICKMLSARSDRPRKKPCALVHP